MIYLITGGTGLIGQALIDLLLEKEPNSKIVVLSRNPHKAKLPDPVLVEEWDAKSVGDWKKWVTAETAIINLAGENVGKGRWTKKKKQRIRQSRLDATKAIADAILQAEQKPYCVIQASATGYYGDTKEAIIDENAPAGKGFLPQLSVEWEQLMKPVIDAGVRVVFIRTGMVLSAKDGALPRLALMTKLFLGAINGSGKQWLSWIHIDDEVGIIYYAIKNENIQGPINLVAPESVTNKEFMKTLGKVLHRPVFMRMPRLPVRILIGEFGNVLYESQRVIPKKIMEYGYEFKFPHLKEALEDLLKK